MSSDLHDLPPGFQVPPKREFSATDRTREAMHTLPYGIYVIGSTRAGDPNAMIADWVMQVSFEPRLIAVSLENDSTTLENVRHSQAFTVNLLHEDGMELAGSFLQPRDGSKIKGRSDQAAAQLHRKLDGVAHTLDDRGCPILDDALAWLRCELEQLQPAGDHTLTLGRVVEGRVLRDGDPLTSVYTGWTYAG